MKTLEFVALFIPLYESLRIGGDGRRVFELDLSKAPACKRTHALYLHQTEGEYPSMSSFVHAWWRIDRGGVDMIPDSPYPTGHYTSTEYIERPKVKFTHSNTEILFGLSLGPEWYVKMHALIQDGCLASLKRIYPAE